MSIYATLWRLKFPINDYDTDCEWITVIAQGVPSHVGSPAEPPYAGGDPYASFLPPAITSLDDDVIGLRAVVIVHERAREKVGQKYVNPLLVLTGAEYVAMSFETLHTRIEEALEAITGR